MSETLTLEENIELNNSLVNTVNETLQTAQENFLESTLGKVINSAIDIGLKAVLPDLIEDEIISIKNTVFEEGFSEAIKEAISSGINIGKSAIGIFTGNFENVSQVEKAVEKGGVIDTVSSLLDVAITKAKKENLINTSVATMIKQGKNTIISTMKDKIGDSLTDQLKSLEKLNSYCEKWNTNYQNQDFKKMETSYKNIEKYLNAVVPLENTINQARKIENLHNLVKNNGNNFDITKEEKELSERLVTN